MTTAYVFLLLAAVFVAAGIYLLRGTRISSSRKQETSLLRLANRPAGILSLVLAALSLTLAAETIVNVNSLPERESNSITPEGGRFPLPAQAESEALAELNVSDPVAEMKHQRKLEAELNHLNRMLAADPHDAISLGDRGAIYAELKSWDLAERDFRNALAVDSKMSKAAFDLAEMEFQQKHFDNARPGFAKLQTDPDLGELATYKVFLCDLFAGHEAVAKKELDAFNQQQSGASYYYANVAWLLYHQKPKEARQWLDSANYIYEETKATLYTSSLNDLGYLPIPPPQ